MIPALIRKMIESPDEVVLWGDGSPTREYLYVDDCVDGLVRAAERYDGAEPVNLGTGVETSIRETAELVAEAVGFEGRITWDTSMPNGQPRRSLDTSRAQRAVRLDARRRRSATASRRRSPGTARASLVERMSRAAIAARSTWRAPALGRAADAATRHVVGLARPRSSPSRSLATVALFFSINHNGWLTYQGGDQIWLVTSGWLLGDGTIGYALTSHGWPMLLAPLTWITGSSSVELLPLTTILQVGVLGPIATLAVYDIGARLAGRLAGLWCAAAFVAAPFVAIPYFVDRYHDSWVDQFLPQALGLTQQADFPSVVAVLVSAALTVRALEAGAQREAVLAGTFAGVALALKPANALFLVGPALAFLLARRYRPRCAVRRRARACAARADDLEVEGARRGAALRAGRGAARGRGAAIRSSARCTTWFDRTVDLNFDTWKENMSQPARVHLERARRAVPAARRDARRRATLACRRLGC